MSKNFKGYMGDQIGKLGTAVGRRWKRKMVYAAYQGRVRNPKTTSQQLARGRFATLGKLANELAPALALGLKGHSDSRQCTEYNSFVHINYDAVTGSTVESLAVNYEALKVSMGGLRGVQFGTPDFSQEAEVTVPIEAANVGTRALADDTVWLVAYCPDMHDMAMSEGAEVRTDETVTVKVPRSWTGMKVYVYGFVQSAKTASKVSESAYIGFGNIS